RVDQPLAFLQRQEPRALGGNLLKWLNAAPSGVIVGKPGAKSAIERSLQRGQHPIGASPPRPLLLLAHRARPQVPAAPHRWLFHDPMQPIVDAVAGELRYTVTAQPRQNQRLGPQLGVIAGGAIVVQPRDIIGNPLRNRDAGGAAPAWAVPTH